MALKKKKGQAGEAKKYISMNRALKILQLNLQSFRRLCILKGIYPREPEHRMKAQHGSSKIQTLYLRKDIAYLSHEPIIWKIREEKIFRRKMKSLKGQRELSEARFLHLHRRPSYRLDHVVLERYPTFDKALQDLDDPLSACFLYAILPNARGIDGELCNVSRRLTSEFLNYVIEARALRKAFISIKGYFYRAHIQGQEVTWMIPHPFTPERNINSDVRVMRVFMEFYCTMLSFVNFKLFQSLNLYYPPRLTSKIKGKMGAVETKRDVLVNSIEALSLPLKKNFVDVAQEDEDYEETLMENPKYSKKLKLAKEEREKVRKQVSLFEGVKFFLGRETNRESLTLLIRCGGGLVSWDRSLGPGSTYQEDDKNILYQIVDRPTCEKKYMTRYYIQPQWVYDSFNAGLILPVQSYFVGAALPAHLSPFEERNHPIYTPPEMLKLKALQGKVDLVGDTEDPFEKFEEKEEEGEREEEEEEEEEWEDEKEEEGEEVLPKKKKKDDGQYERIWNMKRKKPEEMTDEERLLYRMRVFRGRPLRQHAATLKTMQEYEDRKLAATLIHRKQKRMYKRILDRESKTQDWANKLKQKRKIYETEMRKRRTKKEKEARRRKVEAKVKVKAGEQ